MTNKLVVIINSLKVPKIKKILLYEMKFLVPNYSCLQNPWLGGFHPPDPCPLSSTEFVEPPPPPQQNSCVRSWSQWLMDCVCVALEAMRFAPLLSVKHWVPPYNGRKSRKFTGSLDCFPVVLGKTSRRLCSPLIRHKDLPWRRTRGFPAQENQNLSTVLGCRQLKTESLIPPQFIVKL